MLPESEDDDIFLNEDIEEEIEPSLTYALNLDENRIIGKCDDLDAIKQTIYKILSTERYECPLYSWDYGVELKSLFGMPVNYCVSEIERQFSEALLMDDRITEVDNFVFSNPQKGVVAVEFSVSTIYGDIDASKEVEI